MTKRRAKAAAARRHDPADRGPDGEAATSRRTRLVPTEQAGVRATENLDEWLIGGLHARGLLRRSDEPAELADAQAWHRGVLRDVSVEIGSATYMRLIRSVVDGSSPRIHGQLLDDLRALAIYRGQWPG
jgi:hypothetical protein